MNVRAKATPDPGAHALDLEWHHLDQEKIAEVVQSILSEIDREVVSRFPCVRIVGKLSSAPAWLLFVYRTFSVPDREDIDPVVAGVTIRSANEGLVATADISGETRGDVLFEATPRVLTSGKFVASAARDAASELVQHSHVIADALADLTRREQ